MYNKKVGCLWQEKVGRLINESAFIALNVTFFTHPSLI